MENSTEDMYNDDDLSEEFEELDQISRVALLIDDLNNEDPLAQQNSIEKLGTIVQVLGVSRCVDELLPMLTELIDKIDNNTELLMHLAIELGNLTDFLSSRYWIELWKPLELICSADESVVRNKTQEALIKVWDWIQSEEDKKEFVALVERLSKGDLFSMRISSCFLLAKSYFKTQQIDIREKIFKELSIDDTPMVRRAIAINLGDFAEVISYPYTDIVNWYKSLLSDQQDAVKIEALKNSVRIARLLSKHSEYDIIENDILLPVKTASKDTKSWRLRFSVAELIDDLTEIVGHDLADKHIKEIIEALLGDSEPEVRSEIIIKVTKVVDFIKPDQILEKLMTITTDQSQHVRESLAEWVWKIAEHIDCDLFVEKAIPGMLQLVKDTATEVRVSILNHIEIVTKSIGSENTQKHIIPALLELTTDKQWRVRYGITQFFPKFADIFGQELYHDKLEKVSLDLLTDNVYKIREQSMMNIVDLKKTLGNQWFVKICKEKIREFSRSDKCPIRLQAIFLTKIIHKDIDLDILNKDLLPVIIGLKDDIVPNIRFNIAKLLDELSSYLNREIIFIGKSALETMRDNDVDDDVKFFSAKTLNNSVFQD